MFSCAVSVGAPSEDGASALASVEALHVNAARRLSAFKAESENNVADFYRDVSDIERFAAQVCPKYPPSGQIGDRASPTNNETSVRVEGKFLKENVALLLARVRRRIDNADQFIRETCAVGHDLPLFMECDGTKLGKALQWQILWELSAVRDSTLKAAEPSARSLACIGQAKELTPKLKREGIDIAKAQWDAFAEKVRKTAVALEKASLDISTN